MLISFLFDCKCTFVSVLKAFSYEPGSTGLAGFSRSRLATLSFVKISMCSFEKPGWPGYRYLGFCDGDLVNWDENFPV